MASSSSELVLRTRPKGPSLELGHLEVLKTSYNHLDYTRARFAVRRGARTRIYEFDPRVSGERGPPCAEVHTNARIYEFARVFPVSAARRAPGARVLSSGNAIRRASRHARVFEPVRLRHVQSYGHVHIRRARSLL